MKRYSEDEIIQQKRILLLYGTGSLTMQEVSEIMGLPYWTVRYFLRKHYTNKKLYVSRLVDLQVIPQGELNVCPFCGGRASYGTMKFSSKTVKQQGWGQEIFHFINCVKCGANNKCLELGYTTKEKAKEHWDKRAYREPQTV